MSSSKYIRANICLFNADGNRVQGVTLAFEATIVGGEAGLMPETTDYGSFTEQELETIDVMETTRSWIQDAITDRRRAFIR